jgi:hypothetical protein
MNKKGVLCLLSTDFSIVHVLFFSSDVIICPKCGGKTLRKNLILDRGFKNDIQTLSIICSLCDWTGTLKNYQVSYAFVFNFSIFAFQGSSGSNSSKSTMYLLRRIFAYSERIESTSTVCMQKNNS